MIANHSPAHILFDLCIRRAYRNAYLSLDQNEDKHRPSQDNHWIVEAGSLESAESHLKGSPGTGDPGDGSREAFAASFEALVEWGIQNALIRDESEFPFLHRPPDGHGDEHEAWFDESSNRWFKLTYPGRFGLPWGREGTATAREYVSRLLLQNYYFMDDIRLVALLNCNGRLRVATSQPHVVGDPATYQQIQAWFLKLEFFRLETGGRIAWYHRPENLLVADAHEGNVIRAAGGELVPIDLNMIRPSGALLEWAQVASAAQPPG